MNSSNLHTWHLDQLRTETTLPGEGLGLWLPGEQCTLHRIPKPAAPRRKWPGMLPWLIEERVLEPVEQMHVSVIGEEGDSLLVLSVSRRHMDAALALAGRVGVTVQAMQPDFQALPWQPGEITVAWRLSDQGRVLVVRDGEHSGFAAGETLAARLLGDRFHDAADPLRLRALMPAEALPAFLQDPDVICDTAPDWHAPTLPGCNLLHGHYQQVQAKPAPRLSPWLTAAMVVLAVALAWGWLSLANSRMQAELDALAGQGQQLFARGFPGIAMVDNDRRQTLEQVQADRFLQREKLQEPVAALLLALDPVIDACGCSVMALSLQPGDTWLQLSGQVQDGAFAGLAAYTATARVDDSGNTRVTLRREG